MEDQRFLHLHVGHGVGDAADAEAGFAQAGEGHPVQLTITWDSLPGRRYQLQILQKESWVNAPQAPVVANAAKTSLTFPMPQQKAGIYRILLLGF